MTHTAEIISVGTELLLGNTTNTDARDISEMLSELGINVFYQTVVGDNDERLKSAVAIAKTRADIIITTGGLGPTYDDMTKQTLAACFGKKLFLNELEAEKIRQYFITRMHTAEMTENNLQQAMLPEDCTIFSNACGTAPGCAFEADGIHVLMLPGPPSECVSMFRNCAMPYLRSMSDAEIVSHKIHIFGRGESAIEALLRPLMVELENPTLAPYAKEGEVMLRLTAKAKTEAEAEALMAPVLKRVTDALGDIVYGVDTESLEKTVLKLMTEKRLTLATAESCTGGLVSKRITDIPGSSAIFLGGAVTYANEAKTSAVGVPAELIAKFGAVSRECAVSMAEGARRSFCSDLAVSVTGIAGPANDSVCKDVGLVYVALATGKETFCRRLHIGDNRSRVRTVAASHALDMIRRYLTGLPVTGEWEC